jgi:hypothetical protein
MTFLANHLAIDEHLPLVTDNPVFQPFITAAQTETTFSNQDLGYALASLVIQSAAPRNNTFYITFNYDRLLEYKIRDYIYNTVQSDINNTGEFKLKIKEELLRILRNKFYHPHGFINWYSDMDDNSKIGKDRSRIGNLANFGEFSKVHLEFAPEFMASCFDCGEDKDTFLSIKDLKLEPDEVYILGNSLYGLGNNLKKLPCGQWSDSVQRVVCTSFNDDDREAHRQVINTCFDKEMDIEFYKTCAAFAESEIS